MKVAKVLITAFIIVAAILAGCTGNKQTLAATTTTVTPVEKVTTVQTPAFPISATPEAMRDYAVITSPTNTPSGIKYETAEATMKALCSRGYRARMVIFRFFIPGGTFDEQYRFLVVVEWPPSSGNYEFLRPEANTPAVPLGTSDNPIPTEEKIVGAPLSKGESDFGLYCPK